MSSHTIRMHLQGLKNVAWGEIASGGNRISHDRHGNTEFHSFGLQTTPPSPFVCPCLAFCSRILALCRLWYHYEYLYYPTGPMFPILNWARMPHNGWGVNSSAIPCCNHFSRVDAITNETGPQATWAPPRSAG